MKKLLLIILAGLSVTQIKAADPYDQDPADYASPIHDQHTTECSICTDIIKANEPVGTMPKCVHGSNYHRECLNEWRKDNDSCPECREDITVFDPAALTDEERLDLKRMVKEDKARQYTMGVDFGYNTAQENAQNELEEALTVPLFFGFTGGTMYLLTKNNTTYTNVGIKAAVLLLTHRAAAYKYRSIEAKKRVMGASSISVNEHIAHVGGQALIAGIVLGTAGSIVLKLVENIPLSCIPSPTPFHLN